METVVMELAGHFPLYWTQPPNRHPIIESHDISNALGIVVLQNSTYLRMNLKLFGRKFFD